MTQPQRKFPPWIKKRLPANPQADRTREILERYRLNTVCRSAQCPNTGECFARGTATFMIMGNTCTRSCRFCAVEKGIPEPLEQNEPERVAAAARDLKLKHVVVTSVTRDDLEDGGASHFAATIEAMRRALSGATIEVLVPDFGGKENFIRVVLDARPDVFNHNVETVPSLYPQVRPEANYELSLRVLKAAKDMKPAVLTKSGLMVGLGEKKEEVEIVMRDLLKARCDILTIGQYLRPSPKHLPVAQFIEPSEFERYRELGIRLGFRAVASAPFVRSSYHAGEVHKEATL
jgi:lipoic acid synthetase